MAYSSEILHQIWNDKTGERLEVGPDRDGLGLLEIRSYSDDGKVADRVSAPRKQMRLLAEAILKLTDES